MEPEPGRGWMARKLNEEDRIRAGEFSSDATGNREGRTESVALPVFGLSLEEG